jgi:hypothetical protein
MACTPERLAANRRNAQKSTGPRTDAGKERSRANALKHGLTGAGIVTLEADLEQVDALSAQLQHQLNPPGPLGRILTRRVAVHAVRMERCVRQEFAELAKLARHAEADFDARRLAEVDAAVALLPLEPAKAARLLKTMPEGIDWLIDHWTTIRADLVDDTRDLWSWGHRQRFENLMRRHLGNWRPSRVIALCEAMEGNFAWLETHESQGVAPHELKAWARRELAGLIDAELESLRALRPALDQRVLEVDRAEVEERARFDDSHKATLARKYEAASERAMFKALREIAALKKADKAAETVVKADEANASTELASFVQDPPEVKPDGPSAHPVEQILAQPIGPKLDLTAYGGPPTPNEA